MKAVDRAALRTVAYRVADTLLADLKAGKIAKIDMDAIEAACEAETGPLPRRQWQTLLDLTTRRVVERAAR